MTRCCTHACNQGRDCPNRVRRAVLPLVRELLAAMAQRWKTK